MNCSNHPDRERIAFCQNCGKALCKECARTVGTAVFCEPCLEARLSGQIPGYAASGTAGGSTNFNTGTYSYADPADGYAAGGGIPPQPPPPGAPNPGLAALLGFIPGVGAMYTGQHAKGIVHLIIFAVLVSLADEHGIFGLFVTGWIFYQVFEAYQTARARRDATPLPNPFGLNDLGERLGFGKNWAGVPTGSAVPPSPGNPPSAAYAPPAAAYPPPNAVWGTPNESPYGSSYNPPYAAVPPAFDPNAPWPRNRFPGGALWLIGFGVFFLISNSGLFHGLRADILFPFFMIALGVWLFVRRMTATGATLADDGTPYYRMRLFGALRASVWVLLVGVTSLLSHLHILSWGRSWPLFIIVAGVMILMEKTMYNPVSVPPPFGYPVPPASPSPTAEPSQNPSSNSFNQEGR